MEDVDRSGGITIAINEAWKAGTALVEAQPLWTESP